jgi:hypothetical protein
MNTVNQLEWQSVEVVSENLQIDFLQLAANSMAKVSHWLEQYHLTTQLDVALQAKLKPPLIATTATIAVPS